MRRILIDQSEVRTQLQQIKERLGEHDVQLNTIYEALENLLDKDAAKRQWDNGTRIGFTKGVK